MAGLSSAHEILIALALRGGPEYNAQMKLAAENTGLLGKALLKTSAQMNVATERTWLHNQALFTARRYAFYATLAITGLAYEVLKLGFTYNSTVQTAKVALKGMFPDPKRLQDVIDQLYKMSTFSPFLFKDTLTAFRVMAPAMKNAGISVGMTLKTMQASMDALSEAGKATPANLGRISTQLQHMANIGKPTGQVLLALARDGLPVYPALRKELHLTGNALEQVAGSGLTAKQVIQALNTFIETSPIYQGAAFNLATKSLQGNWMMFKDILAQAAGSTTSGLFGGLTKRLKAINVALRPDVMAGKPIGILQVVQAIDQSLTPNTHIIINLFNVFATTIRVVAAQLKFLFTIIQLYLWMPEKLASLFGANNIAAKAFGIILGTLITVFILAKAALIPFMIALDLWKGVTAAAAAIGTIYRITLLLTNGEYAAAIALIGGKTIATEADTAVTEANNLITTTSGVVMDAATAARIGATVATAEQTAAMVEQTAAIQADSLGMASLTAATEIYTVDLGAGALATFAFTTATETATVAAIGFGAVIAAWLPLLALAAAAILLVIKYHRQIGGWGDRIVSGVTSFVQHPVRGVHNIRKHPGHAGHTLLDFLFPEVMGFRALTKGTDWNPLTRGFWPSFQHGGTMSSSGWAMVGEGGPEMVHLPGGANVHPLGGAGGGPFNIRVYPQDIYLDGKKIATVIATAVTDKEARK